MDHPKKLFPLFLILNYLSVSLLNPITSELRPDIIIKTDGNVCLLANLNIKFFDGSKEITIPEYVVPEGKCYKNGELNPEIIYKWSGNGAEVKNTVVVRWKHEINESYVNFVNFVVESEKTAGLNAAYFSDLHELSVINGYRWQCNETIIVRDKIEPNKFILFSGIYQIGENLGYTYSEAQYCKSNKTERKYQQMEDAEKFSRAGEYLWKLSPRNYENEESLTDPQSAPQESSTDNPSTMSSTESSTDLSSTPSTDPNTSESTQSTGSSETTEQIPTVPTPSPDKPANIIFDSNNKTCIAASLNIKIRFPYTKNDNTTALVTVLVPTTLSNVAGQCNSSARTYEIVYSWDWDQIQANYYQEFDEENNAMVQWKKEDNFYFISSMMFTITQNDPRYFPDAYDPEQVISLTVDDLHLMAATEGHSSQCKNGQSTSSSSEVLIEVSGTYELDGGKSDGFSEPDICSEDASSTGSSSSTSSPPTVPTPSPDKPANTVTDNNNTICIAASLIIKIEVPYTKIDNTNQTVKVPVPTTLSNVAGHCDSDAGTYDIIYSWDWSQIQAYSDQLPDKENNAMIQWKKNDSVYSISSMAFAITPSDPRYFPDAKDPDKAIPIVADDLHLMKASEGHSSRCESGQSTSTTSGAVIEISGTYELDGGKDDGFTDPQLCLEDIDNNDCNDDDGSLVAAIAGGTIAGLIVLLVVAAFGLYFYRRHKVNHQKLV